ncbi:MAG: hypothetical protein IKL53_10255 [Lachnospiraceae bacterium]|nr:hypothetical protein [Lachnospiraceae bacterium]
MQNDFIIHSCNNASCTVPMTTGKCLQACWDRYNKDIGISQLRRIDTDDNLEWVTCHKCNFRIPIHKSMVKYNYCPICGNKLEESK